MLASKFKRTALATGLAMALLGSAAMIQLPGHAETQPTIVQGHNLAAVKSAVLVVGGEITHELGVINAVGASLTEPQRAALAKAEGIRRLYGDRSVEVSMSGETQTVRDEFTEKDYTANYGTVDWAGDWLEVGDGGGPASGAVFIATRKGRLHMKRPDNALSRSVYLPTGSQATLSLEALRARLTSAEHYVRVEVSADGGVNWDELGRIQGPDNDASMQPYSFDISAYASPDTMIRLYTSEAMNGDTRIWFDNVQVEYSSDVVSTEVVEYVEDSFTAQSYANNDGTFDWSGDWVELGDDGLADAGYVLVQSEGRLRLSMTDRGVEREADLSAGSGAVLSFDYRRQALDNANDFIALEISADGGVSWTELDRFAGPDNDAAFVTAQYDVSGYAAANTRIRFRTAPSGMNQYDKLFVDNVKISYDESPDSYYPALVGADALHGEGIDGAGVTVAVIDSGYFSHESLDNDTGGAARVLAQYDAVADRTDPVGSDTDGYGHGVHVISLIASSNTATSGKLNGIAPGAGLVSVKAFNANGQGTYLDVIRAIDWVVAHQAQYDIRVLNLSFSASPLSHYWDDPLNQAVMAAWEAGILVVASAGNTGPAPMTIGVPGNLPYVVTVGAMTDNYTPADGSDDLLASFSSVGPTPEGFLKPELLAPGGHMLGLMPLNANLATQHPEFRLIFPL